SPEMLVAVHAVIVAGGHYVPVDPEAPASVVAHLIDTAQVAAALTVSEASGVFADAADRLPVTIVDLTELERADGRPVTDRDRLAPLRPDHAAYTLFTSGSTGQPKGVTVSHGALTALLTWFTPAGIDPRDERVLVKTPFTFDASVWELFWPLIVGAHAVVAGVDDHREPTAVARSLAEYDITMVQFVPSMLSVFLDEVSDAAAALSTVRRIYTGGEALTPALTQHTLAAAPHATVVNQYGPTEMTVDTTIATLTEPVETVTIGRPAPGVLVRILDGRLRPVPPGVPGELYLGGPQMARGYARASALTAERFVADPCGPDLSGAPGQRLYRTGDLARWTTDGDIEYLGRTDFQVKLHGQRIELGEIESVVSSVPGVVAAAADVRSSAAGDALVAYVVGHPGDTLRTEVIADAVADRLLAHLRPSVWVVLDAMPRNSAGKIDRRALPDLAPAAHTEVVAPSTPAETTIAAVVAEVLGVDQVSVTDSFFDIGGNSLAAMRVAARAGAALGVDIAVRDLFDAPTVADLARRVAGRGVGLPPVRAHHPRPERIPLSYAQQRIWFIN
ncbi:MAG TPA: non-ribosomal peptide synthetase, partial [Gordonia polyisoprenivorans]|nr:non-ribosomal peptide synthetase [Gordonia polyisoprenivorans]